MSAPSYPTPPYLLPPFVVCNKTQLFIRLTDSGIASLANTNIYYDQNHRYVGDFPTGSPTTGYISYPTYVYVDGILQSTNITPAVLPAISPAPGSNSFPVSMLFTVQLYEPISRVTISKSNTNLSTTDRVDFYVIVIPGGTNTTNGALTQSVFQFLEVFGDTLTGDVATDYSYMTTGNVHPVSNIGNAQAWTFPLLPTETIPVFLSHFAGTGVDSPSYTDSYGRVIDFTNYTTTDGVIANALTETITIQPNIPLFYAKLQSLWQSSPALTSALSWDENGYIKDNVGVATSYTIYPITQKGYTTLTVVVSTSSISVTLPDEYTHYCFEGQTFNIPEVVTGIGNGTGWQITGNVTYSIVMVDRSVKFEFDSKSFNIVAFPVPSLRQVTVGMDPSSQVFKYQIWKLLNLDPRLTNTDLFAVTEDGSTPILPVNGTFRWTAAPETGDIKISNLLTKIADVKVVEMDLSVRPVYAREGRKIDLFGFFNASCPGSTLVEVYNPPTDNVVSSPDGTITFGNPAVTTLECKVIINGVEIFYESPNAIPVIVISESAEIAYVTSDYAYPITIPTNGSIELVDGKTGEQVRIKDTTSRSEADFTKLSSTSFTAKVKQECLILYGDVNDTHEVNLIPFPAFPTNGLTFTKDSTGSITIDLPHGPTYVIDTNAVPVGNGILKFNGGTKTFSNPASDLYLVVRDLNQGNAPVVPIKLVEGQDRILALVNQNTISSSNPISPLPSAPGDFITISGSDLIVRNNPLADMTIPFLVFDTNLNQYIQYKFKVLPAIKTTQKLYFLPNQTYDQILPAGEYQYDAPTRNLITTQTLVSPGSISANYGELLVDIELTQYDGTAVKKGIYLTTTLSSINKIHTTSGNDITALAQGSGYISAGVTITLSVGNIATIQKSDVSDNVPELFFIDFTGTAKLYQFHNLPPLSHPDVFVPTGNQWIADVDIDTGAGIVAEGGTYTFPLGVNEETVNMHFDSGSTPPLNDYAGETTFTFNIVNVQAQTTAYRFAINLTPTSPNPSPSFSDPIVSYMITAPNKIPFSGSASFKTNLFEVKIFGGVLYATAIAPDNAYQPETSSPGAVKVVKELVFVTTKDNTNALTTHGIQLISEQIPLAPVVTMTFYNDDPRSVLNDLIPPNAVANTTITSPAGTTAIIAGSNSFTYTFYGDSFSTKVKVSYVAKPLAFTATRIIKINEVVQDAIVEEQFGNNFDQVIQSVTSSSPSDLSVAIGQNGLITMTGHTVSISTGYTVTIVIVSSPGASNDPNGVDPVTLSCSLTVFVYDPANTRKYIAQTTTSLTNTRTPIPVSSINGTLLHFSYNGQELTGTSHQALDWSLYDAGTVSIFSKSAIVTPYFLFTTQEVVYFVVIILPASIPSKKLLFPSGSSVENFNMLEIFLPGLGDSLVDAGVDPSFLDYPIHTIDTSLPVPLIIPSGQSFNPLFTLNFTCVVVQDPTLLIPNQTPEFVIPMNQSFTVTSIMVSPDSILSIGDSISTVTESVRNNGDGIVVFFSTTTGSPFTVSCLLTRDGTTTVSQDILFTVYDPTKTEVIRRTSFLSTFSGVFSSDILSYTVDNITYNLNTTVGGVDPVGITPSKFVTDITGPTITVQLTADRPEIIVTLKLASGEVGIFKGLYMLVTTNTKKIYLVTPTGAQTPATNAESRTVSDLSDVPATILDLTNVPVPVGATIVYDTTQLVPQPPLPPTDTYGTRILAEDGTITGWLTTSGLTATFYPNQPGVWKLEAFFIKIGTTYFPIFPYVETLASLFISQKQTIAEIGDSVVIDANQYVIGGIGSVIFTNWMVDSSLTIPPIFSIAGGLIISGVFSTAHKYAFSSTVQSTKAPALTAPLNFELIVVDPADLRQANVLLIGTDQSTLVLSDNPSTIDGNKVKVNNFTTTLPNGLKITINGTQLTFSTNITLPSALNLTIVTEDALQYYITVTQVESEKNISILSQGYTGNLFKQSPGSTVVSYTATGSNSTYLPGHLYNIGGASISIQVNGDYDIENASNLTFSVTYLLPGGTSPSSPLNVSVGSGTHPLQTIDQGSTQTVSLGTNVIRVLIAGSELADGETLPLSYATFTLNGNLLKISEISPEFQPTLVQAENQLKSGIKIVSMLIDIKRDVPSQITYMVPLNSTIQFGLSFEPAKVVYGDLSWSGSNQVVRLLTNDGTQFGTLTISGSAVIVTSKSISAFSKAVGFMDSKGAFTYAYVKIYDPTAIGSSSPVSLRIGDTIQAPVNLTFQSVGLLDGSAVVSPPAVLVGTIQVNPTALIVLASSLTQSFTFYATLSDGSVQIYTIRYVRKDIFTSDLTKIPIRAFTGATGGSLAFTDSSLTTTGNIVNNPRSLSVITTTAPVYGQFTISILR